MKSDNLTKMVVHNKSLLFKKVRDNILFFVLSKGVAFLAPIFFLNFVSLEEYGVVEFSYALGSVLAVVAMLGLGGAYPYFVLRRGERDKKQVFMLYGVPVLGIAVIACLLRWYGAIGQRFSLILLFTLIFALQRLYSSILKSEDKGWLGVLFDGGYYFILTGVILVIWSFGITHHVMLLEAAMQVYLFVLGGCDSFISSTPKAYLPCCTTTAARFFVTACIWLSPELLSIGLRPVPESISLTLWGMNKWAFTVFIFVWLVSLSLFISFCISPFSKSSIWGIAVDSISIIQRLWA